MKKLVACVVLACFATLTTLQAGEQCSAKTAAACSADAKASCSTEKVSTTAAKSCCATGKVAKKRVIVKGAVLLARR